MQSEKVEIRDIPCPICGAYWGNPDPNLDFPNRPKVGMEDGWWWRCCNSNCKVGYYNPENGGIEYI